MDAMKSQPPRRKGSANSSGSTAPNANNTSFRTQQPRRSAGSGPVASDNEVRPPLHQPADTQQLAWSSSNGSYADMTPVDESLFQSQPYGQPATTPPGLNVSAGQGGNQPQNSSSGAVFGVITAAVIVLALVLGGGFLFLKNRNAEDTSALPAAPSTNTSRYAYEPPETSTSTRTTTTTATKTATSTTTETEDDYYDSGSSSGSSGSGYSEPEEQFPSAPYDPPTGYTWVTNGPFGTGTSSNCIQIADSEYQQGGSDDYTECFEMSDGWYYYSLRGAG